MAETLTSPLKLADDFGGGAALATDVDGAGLGFGYADALEVEVFHGAVAVGVNGDVVDAAFAGDADGRVVDVGKVNLLHNINVEHAIGHRYSTISVSGQNDVANAGGVGGIGFGLFDHALDACGIQAHLGAVSGEVKAIECADFINSEAGVDIVEDYTFGVGNVEYDVTMAVGGVGFGKEVDVVGVDDAVAGGCVIALLDSYFVDIFSGVDLESGHHPAVVEVGITERGPSFFFVFLPAEGHNVFVGGEVVAGAVSGLEGDDVKEVEVDVTVADEALEGSVGSFDSRVRAVGPFLVDEPSLVTLVVGESVLIGDGNHAGNVAHVFNGFNRHVDGSFDGHIEQIDDDAVFHFRVSGDGHVVEVFAVIEQVVELPSVFAADFVAGGGSGFGGDFSLVGQGDFLQTLSAEVAAIELRISGGEFHGALECGCLRLSGGELTAKLSARSSYSRERDDGGESQCVEFLHTIVIMKISSIVVLRG